MRIADDRATYYADRDCGKLDNKNTIEWKKVYQEEYKITLEDEEELLDWARNNTDWDDVKDVAEKAEGKPINKSKEWTNAEMKYE